MKHNIVHHNTVLW